jgi:glyoxylase-like metal-dependent hydrolase (beta-lactamase superfamily II)
VYFVQAFAKVQPTSTPTVNTFLGNTALCLGIRSKAAPGHTLGHGFYVLESRGETLVFWSDLLHVAEVKLPRPEVTVAFYVDPEAATPTTTTR